MICSCVLQKPDCKQQLQQLLLKKEPFVWKVATIICLLLMCSNDIESFRRVGMNNNCVQIISLERDLHSEEHALALGWEIRHCCPSLLSTAALYQTFL